LTALAYKKNIRNHLSRASHKLTVRDVDVKVELVDQYGDPYPGKMELDFDYIRKTVYEIEEMHERGEQLALNVLASAKDRLAHNTRLALILGKGSGYQSLLPTPEELEEKPDFWQFEPEKEPPPVVRPKMTEGERGIFSPQNIWGEGWKVPEPKPEEEKREFWRVITDPIDRHFEWGKNAIPTVIDTADEWAANALAFPKSVLSNTASAIDSLQVGEEIKWHHNMDFRQYCEEHKRKFGVKTPIDYADELKEQGLAGEIAGTVMDIALETATDPLLVISYLKALKAAKPSKWVAGKHYVPAKLPKKATKARKPKRFRVTGKISKKDAIKISRWKNRPSNELYIKYKKVYNNPKYFNQNTGNPIYPGTNGDPNVGGFVKGVSKTKTLQPGTRIDRYGRSTGKYASPEGTPYGERALAPGANTEGYYVYEVVKPVKVKSGKIQPWFDEVGGGVQYQFSDTIEYLLDKKILEKVN
ncbi:MAG: TNT domain-containing protein, partial [Oscillospiraceae bacterium]|nr:TNT domain-containing protein [Oscillospiraceae bacterium]